jgi:hypothetical protein
MNKTSLAKAIGIVFGIIFATVGFVALLATYKILTVIFFGVVIASIVIALLWQCILMVYDNIEYKKKGYWDN